MGTTARSLKFGGEAADSLEHVQVLVFTQLVVIANKVQRILLEMVVNEFESKLLEDRYNQFSSQSNSTQDESYPPKRADNWHLLHPEVVQHVSTTENSSNVFPLPCSDLVDDEVPPLSSVERSGLHRKSFSLVSDSSSEDVIVLDVGYDSGTISSTSAPLKQDDMEENISASNIHNVRKHDNKIDNNVKESLPCTSFDKSHLSRTSSPMQNPPAQVMERSGGYDPHRIPQSVFCRNDSSAPGEWSIASNESLFSLHLGNASLDREHALLLNGDLKAITGWSRSGDSFSGELMDDPRKSSECSKSDDVLMSSPQPPAIDELEDEKEVTGVKNEEKKEVLVELRNESLNKSPVKTNKERQQHQPPSTRSSSVSYQSDASEESNSSFAFPILSEVDKFTPMKGLNHLQHSEQHEEEHYSLKTPSPPLSLSPPRSPPRAVNRNGCCYCFSQSSNFSYSSYCCNSCTSCTFFYSCWSCKSCRSKSYTWRFCCPKLCACKSCWPRCC